MGDTKTASNLSDHTANEFTAFFAEKVDSVHQATSSTPLPHVPATAKQELREWEPVTSEDVAKLISEAPSKSNSVPVKMNFENRSASDEVTSNRIVACFF